MLLPPTVVTALGAAVTAQSLRLRMRQSRTHSEQKRQFLGRPSSRDRERHPRYFISY